MFMSTETIRYLIHPFTILWILLVGSVLLFMFKKKRLFKWVYFIMIGWFFLISTPIVPVYLLKSLENQYEPLINIEEIIDMDHEYHIVVLGAGYRSSNRLPDTSKLMTQTLNRLVEGIRLYNALPNSKLITSGPYSFSNQPSQAEVAKAAAISLGVPDTDIFTQSEPYNTLEEAEIYSKKFYRGQKVIVVTDAAHMPRAIYEFEKFIDAPIASPANLSYSHKGISYSDLSIIPSYTYIQHMNRAMIEYAATFRNKLRDW